MNRRHSTLLAVAVALALAGRAVAAEGSRNAGTIGQPPAAKPPGAVQQGPPGAPPPLGAPDGAPADPRRMSTLPGALPGPPPPPQPVHEGTPVAPPR